MIGYEIAVFMSGMAHDHPGQLHVPFVLTGEIPSKLRRWQAAGAVAFLLGIYAIFLGSHAGAYAGGADSSGYLNHAKLLAQGTPRIPERVIAGANDAMLNDTTYVPIGLTPVGGQMMAGGYPTGVPLILAAVSRFTGWATAPAATAVLFSLLGILATAWLGCVFGLPLAWAWFAAALLAITPTYVNMSLQLMSDVPAAVFSAATIAFAWKSRARHAWAAAAGAAFAAGVLVRPSDIIMFVPAAICLGLIWRRWLFFGLGGLPGAVFFCFYNLTTYGHPLDTGYGDATFVRFTLKAIPPSLANYAHWLPFVLTPVGLLAFALPFLYRRGPVRVSVLLSWIFVVLGFYSVDRDTQAGVWILRYLLPAFPAFVVCGVMVLNAIVGTNAIGRLFERMSAFLPQWAMWLAIWAPAIFCSVYSAYRFEHEHDALIHYAPPALCIAVAAWLGAKMRREKVRGRMLLRVTLSQLMLVMALAVFIKTAALGMLEAHKVEIVYPEACAWAAKNLPPDAVIYSMQTSGALLYYTPFTVVRWNVLMTPAAQAEIARACAASHRPIYAMLFPFEIDALREMNLFEGWTKIASMPPITFWRLDSAGQSARTP